MTQLPGFESFEHSAGGMTFQVFVAGEGPAIVLIHELPSITPALLQLSEKLAAAGFRVFMPSLLGKPGSDGALDSLGSAIKLCAAREFSSTLADGETRPVVLWLRDLVKAAARSSGVHQRVGVLGLCFSGGFALGAAVEAEVAGAVACEPSLPFLGKRRLGIGRPDIRILNERVERGEVALRAYRFEGDDISPCERMLGLGKAMPNFEGRCIADKHANPSGPKWPAHHSVITTHLIEGADQPTSRARDEIIAFFRWRLADGPAVDPSPSTLRDCLRLGCRHGRRA